MWANFASANDNRIYIEPGTPIEFAGTYNVRRWHFGIENYFKLTICSLEIPETILVDGQSSTFYDEGSLVTHTLNLEKFQMTVAESDAVPCPTVNVAVD